MTHRQDEADDYQSVRGRRKPPRGEAGAGAGGGGGGTGKGSRPRAGVGAGLGGAGRGAKVEEEVAYRLVDWVRVPKKRAGQEL